MNARKSALTRIASATQNYADNTKPYDVETQYGSDVFALKAMEKHLARPVYKKLLQTIRTGSPLDQAMADDIAYAMKTWAIAKGATHYTHWFLPLTSNSAEKHDSFIDPTGVGTAIMRFSGKNLIMGEPDASSFPSGGLRSTFEARGYTAWDPTSPAFLKRQGGVTTLCIPTVFYSYTGAMLDKKTPILRSLQVINVQAKRLLKCFGEVSDDKISVTLGAEQEYFLIDKNLYLLRPDLIQTGRTLFGTLPHKHQQLDDHYFASIKPRILAFMSDVDSELWRMGIPAKTRHNEVAPAQFEIAPVFEELNLAIDHNMLIMETLTLIANKHGLICLLHEKPFAGLSGSGKHNNWSISMGERNLLNPGTNPHENAIFLTTLCAVIKAVDSHSDLLRSTAATLGNDLRLGANEAPPSIISIFLGEQLTDIIEQLEKGQPKSSKKSANLKIGIDALPTLPRDVTDRNRTSPFAFTGNKFEFRAVGSSQSCSNCNIVLNTIVAEAFDEIASILEVTPKEKFNETLQAILQDIARKHKRIIFNGDNYTEAWRQEAKKRGLPNLRTTPEALAPLLTPDNLALFSKYSVFTPDEMKSRYGVFMEEYHKKVHIEVSLALDIAKTVIMPAVYKHLNMLSTAANSLKTAGVDDSCSVANAKKVAALNASLNKACAELEAAIEADKDPLETIPAMNEVRKYVDLLEMEVDDFLWPLPKYSELLFFY